MIKLFEQYNEYNKVKEWLDEMYIHKYTINEDLTVDVDGNVMIANIMVTNNYTMKELPIQFGRVEGYFNCNFNKLTTLKGCPSYVGNYFSCNSNYLASLEYSPKYVQESVFCMNNTLTTLKYSPEYIGSDFYASNNPLTNLINNTKELSGSLVIKDCDYLPYPIRIIYNTKGSIDILLKYQDDYGIWNKDGSFNEGRWNIFEKDYEDGKL